MPKVYNKRDNNFPSNSIYVGRPSKWGNPHPVEQVCRRCSEEKGKRVVHDRQGAIKAYIEDAEKSIGFVERARRDLEGMNLVCWCAPLACHADYLLKVANGH